MGKKDSSKSSKLGLNPLRTELEDDIPEQPTNNKELNNREQEVCQIIKGDITINLSSSLIRVDELCKLGTKMFLMVKGGSLNESEKKNSYLG